MGRVSSLQPPQEMNGSVRQWGEPGWTAVLTDRSAQEMCVPVCVKEATHNEQKNQKYLATCATFAREQVFKRRLHAGQQDRVKTLMSVVNNHRDLTLTTWRGDCHILPAGAIIPDTANHTPLSFFLNCFYLQENPDKPNQLPF